MTKVTIKAKYMTWYGSDQPARCWFNKTGYLNVKGGADGTAREAVLWFANPFTKTGANVVKATLRLRTRAMPSASRTVGVGLITSGLRFGNMTYNNRPSANGALVYSTTNGTYPLNGTWDIDVTPLLQRVADGAAFGGLLVMMQGSTAAQFQGNMGGGLTPQLIVEHTQAPLAPDSLAPSSGRTVGIPQPTLRWDFYDHAGENDLQSVQVQLATTSAFTNVLWDSGEVPTHWCTMNLALPQTNAAGGTTTAPAAAANAVTWWRVRNRDTSGLWSAWSLPASFKYVTKPKVVLNNPSTDGMTINDPTPTIDWTYSGGTQVRYRCGLYLASPGKDGRYRWLLVDSQQGTGATSTWTPDVGLRDDRTYKVVVDVFDKEPRESTPGDPAWSSVVRQFRFNATDTIVGVKNMTVRDNYPGATVTLTWQRDEMPDAWHIYRDDMRLATYNGPDLLVSGNTYSIRDAICPNGKHLWKVFAIVNGKAAKSGGITMDHWHEGTWLCNEDTGERLVVMNDKSHDMHAPESGAVHEVLGSSRVVLITDALRGYEGTVDGILTGLKGYPKTAAEFRDMAWKFKSDVGQQYLLLIEDQAFPVVIRNMDVTGDPDVWGRYRVKFEYYQVGNVDWDTSVAGDQE